MASKQEYGQQQLQAFVDSLDTRITEDNIYEYNVRFSNWKDGILKFFLCIRSLNQACHTFTAWINLPGHWAIRDEGGYYSDMFGISEESAPGRVGDAVSVLKPVEPTTTGKGSKPFLFVPIGNLYDDRKMTSFILVKFLEERKLGIVFDYSIDIDDDNDVRPAPEAVAAARKAFLPGTPQMMSVAILSGDLQIVTDSSLLGHENCHEMEILCSNGFRVEDAVRDGEDVRAV